MRVNIENKGIVTPSMVHNKADSKYNEMMMWEKRVKT